MSLQSILESSIPLLQKSDWNAANLSVELIQQSVCEQPGRFGETNDVGDVAVPTPNGFDELLIHAPSTPWLDAIRDARNSLVWHGSGRAVAAAYCQLVGPGCPYPSDQFLFGIFMVPEQYTYQPHVHGADEIYIPVAGRGEWAMDEQAFQPWPLDTVVPIESMRPHAIRTGESPMLTFYTWTGDITFDRYRFC